MYEKDIQFITDFNLNKIEKSGLYIQFEKLFATDLHPAIIQYISAELDYIIYEDRKKLLEKSAFDYSGSKIAEYFNLIGQEIKRTKKISHEDLQKIITKAVTFNANFIVRPKASLIKLIYNESETKEVPEIKLRLNYLYFYKYLKDVLLTYINKRRVIKLSKSEFELILNKIDNELFSTQAEKLLDNVLSTIADFYNEGGISRKSIPVPFVETFLIEKNLADYLSILKNATTKNKMEIEELRRTLFLTTLSKKEEQEIPKSVTTIRFDEPVKEPASVEVEVRKDKFDSIEDANDVIEIDEAELKSELPEMDTVEEILETDLEVGKNEAIEGAEALLSSPIEEPEIISDEEEVKFDISEQDKLETLYDFEEENQEKPIERIEEIEEEEIINNQGKNEKIKDQEILGIEEESQSISEGLIEPDAVYPIEKSEIEEIKEEERKSNSKSRIKDVFSFLSNKEIEKIISSIFNEDREDFAYTMERIADCQSYDESTEILKTVFFSYKISPYSKEAVLLTNAVANYFDQDD